LMPQRGNERWPALRLKSVDERGRREMISSARGREKEGFASIVSAGERRTVVEAVRGRWIRQEPEMGYAPPSVPKTGEPAPLPICDLKKKKKRGKRRERILYRERERRNLSLYALLGGGTGVKGEETESNGLLYAPRRKGEKEERKIALHKRGHRFFFQTEKEKKESTRFSSISGKRGRGKEGESDSTL